MTAEPDEGSGPAMQPQGASLAAAPRTVIRGESSDSLEQTSPINLANAALTDWLNVTFPVATDGDPADRFFRVFAEATDGRFGGMTDRGRGLHGYGRSFAFDRGGVLFALGGQRNTAFLSLPGDGCNLIPDWPRLVAFLRGELGGRITRWDGAVDDFDGKHSVDIAVELYLLGGFNCGGSRPSCNQAGNWLEPDGRGRTFYVGQRTSGKLARIYEKGKQLGRTSDPWVRWEVELHNVDRYVPWEAVLEPGRYVAGAYPCLTWVSDSACRIRTVKAQHTISYERLVRCGALAYGALINVMLEEEGSPERVVEKLRRAGAPRRLGPTRDFLRMANSDAL